MTSSPVRVQRIPLSAPGRVTWRGKAHEGAVCNLSLVGMYVALDSAIPEGQAVEVRFAPPDGHGEIACEATVVWRNERPPGATEGLPPGCGLRFASVAPVDLKRIESLIENYPSSAPRSVAPLPYSGQRRIPFVTSCTLFTDSATSSYGVLCNLSLSGAFVAVEPTPPLKTRLRLAFSLPRIARPVVILCEVAWINPKGAAARDGLPPGCGLRFISLAQEALVRIGALIDEYTVTPRATQ